MICLINNFVFCASEKARLQAEAKAAEEARRKAEAEAAAETKRKREEEREAARQALQKVGRNDICPTTKLASWYVSLNSSVCRWRKLLRSMRAVNFWKI